MVSEALTLTPQQKERLTKAWERLQQTHQTERLAYMKAHHVQQPVTKASWNFGRLTARQMQAVKDWCAAQDQQLGTKKWRVAAQVLDVKQRRKLRELMERDPF